MKKYMKALILSFIGLCLLAGCGEKSRERQIEFKQWIQRNGKIKVLSTTAMINDLVRAIGKEDIDAITLIQGNLDPHSYQLVKGDDEKLSFADLIFFSGLGLEHGPSLYHYLLNNEKAVSLGDGIEKKYPQAVIWVGGQKDPHIWMDISLWAKTIPIIVESLSKANPSNALSYQHRGKALENEIMQAHNNVRNIMLEIPENQRYLVTSHDAFNYFTRAYLSTEEELKNGGWEKRFAAPEGLAPESQLSTTNIRYIINHMRKYNIELLFPESNVSRDSIKKIKEAGREQGLNLEIACCPLYGDAMGPEGSEGDTYVKMIVYNAKMIASFMKPTQNDITKK